jgi:YD repeat-containing protein
LNFIGFGDGSYTRFSFNGYGQATSIKHFASDSNPASDNHQLNATVYNYDTTGDDCPRIIESRVTAENWTGINGVPSEVVTQFNASGDGSHIMIAPDNTIYKEFYGGTGGSPAWQHGLVTSTQVLTGSTVQKATTSLWTQDNTDPQIRYQTNPRVYETNVTDGTNNRRTTIGYQTFALATTNASCSLPNEVYEYDSDQTTVLRRTHSHYLTDTAYLNNGIIGNRLIGLKDETDVYEGTTTLRSKTTYVYDVVGDSLQATAGTPTQHDSRYSTDSSPLRGNVVKLRRWDVSDPNQTAKTENRIGYDIDGSVIFTVDARDHRNSIYYTDKFSADGTNLDAPRSFATFAYPTEIKDADNFSSFLWYRYDFGARTRAQGPPPDNQPNGITETFTYDDAARVNRVTIGNTGAYTHYVYGPNYIQSFGSLNTVAVNYLQSDFYKIETFDGSGRTIAVATNNPNSNGGYSGEITIYDQVGRAVAQSNPTETSASGSPWLATGDDSPANGGSDWVYSQQSYDWKGRPRITTHPDGTYKEAVYQGCGCAGGEMVTVSDEGTVVNGQAVFQSQNTYSDALGRQSKTEVLNFDGSIYSTRIVSYNARDQITSTKQYQSTVDSGVYQEEIETYDGYGRLNTRKPPIQTSATTYNYFEDDKPKTVTDAGGVVTTYGYNNRGLVNGISFSGVSPAPGAISFNYDAAGNRISINDETGNVSYQYDSLSRLQSETRQFSGSGAPAGNYTLSYDYNLVGELKTIIDPTGSRVDYEIDSAGRLLSVSGSGANSAPTYANHFLYRAWGAIKDFDFGNGVHQHLNFNNRLQNTALALSNVNTLGTMSWTYDYYSDGRLSRVTDSAAPNFDRYFDYDHEGRVLNALTGSEARGGTTADGPFRQSYNYDVWENTTSRTNRLWTQSPQAEGPINYPNNRHENWQYDDQGRLRGTYDANIGYDAAGRNVFFSANVYLPNGQSVLEIGQTFDGNSQPVSKTETNRSDPNAPASVTSTYYLRSTALGGKVVAEMDSNGYKRVGHIYAGEMEIATQTIFNPGHGSQVSWSSTNPATGSHYALDNGRNAGREELDLLGADVTNPPDSNPLTVDEPPLYNPKFNDRPLEYSWGPSQEVADAMSWWEDQLAITEQAIAERDDLQKAWQAHDIKTMQAILSNHLAGVQGPDGRSLFGKEAAAFLGVSTGYLEDSFSTDQNAHDLSSAYHVNIYGGAEVFVTPQNSQPQNTNPRTLDNSGASNQSCSIGVSFSGASTLNTQAGRSFGIGFSAKISGLSGTINIRSAVTDHKPPKGVWIVEQWVADYNVLNDELEKDAEGRMDKLYLAAPRIDGGTVSWSDHPGHGSAGIQTYSTARNFYIKAYNEGSGQHCGLGFHMTFQVYNGQQINSGWGPEMYK